MFHFPLTPSLSLSPLSRRIAEEGSGTAVLDFAMNWTNRALREAVQKFFDAASATILPVVLTLATKDLKPCFYNGEWKIENDDYLLKHEDLDGKIRVTLMFISEDKNHDKGFVLHCLRKVLSWLKTNTKLQNLRIFSDGAGQQFKNRFIFGALSHLRDEDGFGFLEKLEWHFFCS